MNITWYLDLEVKFAKQGKIKQSLKLSEWAKVELEKKRDDTK